MQKIIDSKLIVFSKGDSDQQSQNSIGLHPKFTIFAPFEL